MNEYLKIEKREVPQLSVDTGISQDYWNQINGVVTLLKSSRGLDAVKKIFMEITFNMKRYEDVYSGCNNVVNDQNRESVKRLDELAILMNDILKNPSNIDEDILRKTCTEIHLLIYADESFKI